MSANTMQTFHRAQVTFHLTGARVDGALGSIEGLRPALFAPYADLTTLRYDYPLVLLDTPDEQPLASLSSLVDRAIAAPTGSTADVATLRRLLLRQEQAIRVLVAAGTAGTLSELWQQALAAHRDEDNAALLDRAWRMLGADGDVLDCDAALPANLFIHAWQFVQQRKTARMRTRLGRLVQQLGTILDADFAGSLAARSPHRLKAAMGTGFDDAFDFDRLSAILIGARPSAGLSPLRRRRIEGLLAVLEAQPFFVDAAPHGDACSFVFRNSASLLAAWRERMPKMIALSKAIAIAELEVDGAYVEAQHDALFDTYAAHGLGEDDLAAFPDYLLWLHEPAPAEQGQLAALLAGNLPVKVLVQFDDLLDEAALGHGERVLSGRAKQVTDGAIGLNNVFVLQAASSHLLRMQDPLLQALWYAGPTLVSVYSGAAASATVPPYLVAAAAMESRAFPAFVYDPAAGDDWASRFSLAGNAQPESDWPTQSFRYETREQQRVATELAFTLADFMALDARYASHFAQVPPAGCNGALRSVRDWLATGTPNASDTVPGLMMVDRDNVLQQVVVDAGAIEQARRCISHWHSLQELGGIHNSHAARLLAREREAWEAAKQREVDALRASVAASVASTGAVMVNGNGAAGTPIAASASNAPASAAAAAPAATSTATAAPAAAAEEPTAVASDDPWIETPRCTTCEECVQINNKLFVYDANKQAAIADLAAGTYRQLVEAAEACQVSIIHPGKPRNPNEPGLDDLLERAKAFA